MATPINKILINQIQNLSNEELANVSASLSAILGQNSGGEPCASAWRPAVTDEGVLSWTLTTSTTTPTPVNVMGPQGETGPQGPSGTNGTKGDNGFSPTVATATTATEDRTGTVLTFTYGDEGGQTASYTAWNGKDGAGATVDLLEGNGIQITHEIGTTDYTIGVSADYATKTYVDTASAEALSQAKSWTNQQNFATSAGLDDDKQFAMTKTGWAVVVVPSVPDITATNGISANGHNIGLTTDVYSAIQEISAANDLVGANGISVVAGANNQVIIAPSGISQTKQYAMTTTGWEEVQAGTSFTGINTVNGISGDGLSTPVGLHTSAVSAISAVKYEEINANMIAQKLLVVTGDGQIISYVQDGKANGEGCLFFVTSAHN